MKKVKKTKSIFLFLFLCLSFSACGQEKLEEKKEIQEERNSEKVKKNNQKKENKQVEDYIDYQIEKIKFQIPKTWQSLKRDNLELPDLIGIYDFYNVNNQEVQGIMRVKVVENLEENTEENLLKRALAEVEEANFVIEKELNQEEGINVFKAHVLETNLPQEVWIKIIEKENAKLIIFTLTPSRDSQGPDIFQENIKVLKNIIKSVN